MSQFFTLITVLFVSVSSFASAFPGAVWCKVDGKAQNAIVQDESTPCAGALMMGDACYTGSRGYVIDLINNSEIVLSDEEWIENAHFKGQSEVAYTFVDGPNEESSKVSMDRCPGNFFRK